MPVNKHASKLVSNQVSNQVSKSISKTKIGKQARWAWHNVINLVKTCRNVNKNDDGNKITYYVYYSHKTSNKNITHVHEHCRNIDIHLLLRLQSMIAIGRSGCHFVHSLVPPNKKASRAPVCMKYTHVLTHSSNNDKHSKQNIMKQS